MNLKFIFRIHKLVKGKHPQSLFDGGQKVKETLSQEERNQLKKKMMETFKNETNTLSQELQRILADDLVTAFESRLTTLMRIQSKHGD